MAVQPYEFSSIITPFLQMRKQAKVKRLCLMLLSEVSSQTEIQTHVFGRVSDSVQALVLFISLRGEPLFWLDVETIGAAGFFLAGPQKHFLNFGVESQRPPLSTENHNLSLYWTPWALVLLGSELQILQRGQFGLFRVVPVTCQFSRDISSVVLWGSLGDCCRRRSVSRHLYEICQKVLFVNGL